MDLGELLKRHQGSGGASEITKNLVELFESSEGRLRFSKVINVEILKSSEVSDRAFQNI